MLLAGVRVMTVINEKITMKNISHRAIYKQNLNWKLLSVIWIKGVVVLGHQPIKNNNRLEKEYGSFKKQITLTLEECLRQTSQV